MKRSPLTIFSRRFGLLVIGPLRGWGVIMRRVLQVILVALTVGSFALAEPPGNSGGTPGNPNNGNNGQSPNSGTNGNAGGNNGNVGGSAVGNPNNGNNGNDNGRGNAGGGALSAGVGSNGGGTGNATGNPGNGNNGNSGSNGNAGNGNPAANPGNPNGNPGANPAPRPAQNALARRRQIRSHNGQYEIIIAGSVRGVGQATVTDNSVSFSVQVTAPDGTVGSFDATNLFIEGPYFSGPAILFGQSVLVHGRLDAPRSSRLLAIYRGEGAQIGRVVGTLPGDNVHETWDEH
jgi:hypothetical protein